jgi:hypothetical protein
VAAEVNRGQQEETGGARLHRGRCPLSRLPSARLVPRVACCLLSACIHELLSLSAALEHLPIAHSRCTTVSGIESALCAESGLSVSK